MNGQYTKKNLSNAQWPRTPSPKGERDGIKTHRLPPSIHPPQVFALGTGLAMPLSHPVLSPGKMELEDHETGAFTAESNLKANALDMEIETA